MLPILTLQILLRPKLDDDKTRKSNESATIFHSLPPATILPLTFMVLGLSSTV